MMTVFSWRALHTVRKMNQLMSYRHLERLWLHIRLNKDQVTVCSLLALRSRPLRRAPGWCGQITVAAQCHKIEALSRPLAIFLTVLGYRQQSQLARGDL